MENTAQSAKGTNKQQPKINVGGRIVHYKNNEQSLLDCLEAAEIEVHYHCRDGFCGACRVELVEGEIHYPLGEPLAFVGDKEILPCCCIPVTDITLIID